MARGRLPGRTAVETIVDLPIVLPPSVAGLALLLVFGRRGLLGEPLADAGLGLPVHDRGRGARTVLRCGAVLHSLGESRA